MGTPDSLRHMNALRWDPPTKSTEKSSLFVEIIVTIDSFIFGVNLSDEVTGSVTSLAFFPHLIMHTHSPAVNQDGAASRDTQSLGSPDTLLQ